MKKFVVALQFLVLCISFSAFAQRPSGLPDGYPAKPVRVIIGSVPGGATDTMGRLIMPKLGERWNAAFVLENVPGGPGGAIQAMDLVRKSGTDGYTLLVTTSSTVLNAALVQKVPYDMNTAFATIGLLSANPLMFGVSPSVPANNVKEFITYAKANPGKLNYASSSIGSAAHLAAELLSYMAGIKMVHVPYKGTGPAIVDTIAGRTHVIFGSSVSVGPHVKTGKLKTLGVTTAQRLKSQPDVPTVAEQGLPGFEYIGWVGLVGSPVTHPAIVRALNQEIQRIEALPEVEKVLFADGSEPVFLSPDQFRQTLIDGIAKSAKLVKEVGLKLE